LMAIAPFLITIVFAFGVGYGADLTSRLLVFDEVSQAAGFEGMLKSIQNQKPPLPPLSSSLRFPKTVAFAQNGRVQG
jgi:hypothetical protein